MGSLDLYRVTIVLSYSSPFQSVMTSLFPCADTKRSESAMTNLDHILNEVCAIDKATGVVALCCCCEAKCPRFLASYPDSSQYEGTGLMPVYLALACTQAPPHAEKHSWGGAWVRGYLAQQFEKISFRYVKPSVPPILFIC